MKSGNIFWTLVFLIIILSILGIIVFTPSQETNHVATLDVKNEKLFNMLFPTPIYCSPTRVPQESDFYAQ